MYRARKRRSARSLARACLARPIFFHAPATQATDLLRTLPNNLKVFLLGV